MKNFTYDIDVFDVMFDSETFENAINSGEQCSLSLFTSNTENIIERIEQAKKHFSNNVVIDNVVIDFADKDYIYEESEMKTLEEVAKLTNKDVLEQIGELPPQKIHCSVLAEEAIAEAIKDYYKRQEKLAKKS